MRLERLLEPPAPETVPEPREAKVEVAGGSMTITYLPPPKSEADTPTEDFLNRYLGNWNVKDENEVVIPINADVIRALAPEVKDALREAILARPKAKAADRPEKAPEKPAEVAHGSFVAADEKEQPKSTHGSK